MNRIIAIGLAALVASTASAASNRTNETFEKADTIREVVVTATNQATERRLLPFSVSVVDKKQIEATGRTQLLSALTGRVPSLFVTERSILGFGVSTGGSGGIKMRGVGGQPTNQVLMMVDGKPQFASVFSHHVADNYESEYVDHVEIVRGPSSVLYGSNAMGGTINVITQKPTERGSKTTIRSEYGMWNTSQTSATNALHYGKFSSLISLGYDRTDGTQKDFDFWQASGYAKVGYDINRHWYSYADYSLMKFKGNDPIYAKLANPEATDIYHQNVLRGEASAVVSNQYDKTNGAVRLYFGHGDNRISDPKDFKMLDNRIGVLAYQNYQPWKMTNLTVGFDFDRYTGEVPLSGGVWRKDKVTPATMDREGITEYSPYVTLSQGIAHNIVILNAGVRMANSDMFGTHWIPQMGFTLNPGQQWTIKANLAKGYRNPSFKEMYLYKMANPDLAPEDMMNYEVSIGKKFSHWFAIELTGYMSEGKNLIQQVFSNELKAQHNENTGEFRNMGYEVTASSRPADCLSLRGTYSYLQTDVKNLTGAPKHQYSLAADWRIIRQLTLNADLTGVSRLYVAQDVKKQNYALLNLRLTYQPCKYLDLFVQGYNLTNARYCINKGYEMPGASVTGGFTLHLYILPRIHTATLVGKMRLAKRSRSERTSLV